jgi:hypothetical protein
MDDDSCGLSDPVDALAGLFHAGSGELFANLEGPLLWPALSATEASEEWPSLRAWVEQLVHRFSIPAQVVPPCWFRHNALVEGLAALRDHHRSSFSASAAPTAAVDWHRAFRDIEQRLAGWASLTQCSERHHQPDTPRIITPDTDAWDRFIRDDADHRRATAIAGSLVH